jgi:triosephosphate isomerase
MRKKIVAGNWKMNKTLQEGIQLSSEIVNMVKDEVLDDVTVILAPPFIHLTEVGRLISDSEKIFLAAQNCSDKPSGAFTGEISPNMIKSTGASHVIIGHSERRGHFSETNSQLANKVDIALENNLTPIFCCGEPLEIRQKSQHFEFVTNQLTESIFHLSSAQFERIVLAYEPIWAIGTGETATSEQAQEMHAHLRNHLASKFGTDLADSSSILYGGSCKPSNAEELFACPDVDGGLIGGASLNARDFIDIIKSF